MSKILWSLLQQKPSDEKNLPVDTNKHQEEPPREAKNVVVLTHTHQFSERYCFL